jgi:mRNA interferase HigB
MRVIKKGTLKEYWEKHRETKNDLTSWFFIAKKSKWEKPGDVKLQFAKASILNSTRVVFNICGNNYRLVVKINYAAKIIFIRFIGTHEEYDKINAEKV